MGTMYEKQFMQTNGLSTPQNKVFVLDKEKTYGTKVNSEQQYMTTQRVRL